MAASNHDTALAEPAARGETVQPTAQAASARVAKGAQTKQQIVERALHIASRSGLEGLSIGLLADAMGMSKSGVFAHFGSREELQISVIRAYHERFEQDVFMPALQVERGLPRLRALFHNWLLRVSEEIDSGCIYISGAVEFDDRPGAVRDALAGMVRAWHDAMIRAIELAKTCGHLRADADSVQILFELHGLVLALHHDARFMRIAGGVERALTGFERIVALEAAPGAPRAPARTPRAAGR
jgi:AcrR family transcriptional regulator